MASPQFGLIFENGSGGRVRELESGYVPWRFELSFGLEHRPGRLQADPQSRPGAVGLDCGIQLRGSIDLVERHPSGLARVTDHKTGKANAKRSQLVDGGRSLQPLLYALPRKSCSPAKPRLQRDDFFLYVGRRLRGAHGPPRRKWARCGRSNC